MTHLLRAIALATLGAVALVSCGSDSTIGAASQPTSQVELPEPVPPTVPQGEWVLDSFTVEDDIAVPLPDRPVDLRLGVDELAGSAGCNSLGGSASFLDEGSVLLGDLFWTEMACEPASLMDFESAYTQALVAVDAWRFQGDQLILSGPTDQMIYSPSVAPPAVPIVGTRWTLDTFFDGTSAVHQPGMDAVKISFSETGVNASGRCWSIGGFATVEPGTEGNLSVDFSTADPGFSCDDRDFFGPFLERLNPVREYEVIEHRLILGVGGEQLLGFTSVPPEASIDTEPVAPETDSGQYQDGSAPDNVAATGTEPVECNVEFVGQDLTGNRSNTLSVDRLQVVAFYDGAANSSPALRVELDGGVWLTVGGDAPGGSIEGFGRSIATREYIMFGCSPTGRVEVVGIEGNGVVDGLAFGLLWRHQDRGLVMLKSNAVEGQGAAAYVGMWPLGFSRDEFAERTPQITDPLGRESARAIIIGAALVGNGFYTISLMAAG